MAQRGSITYLGSFRDVSYGIDDEGEVFLTLADAAASLHARHRLGYWQAVPITKPNGVEEEALFPSVTDDAAIYLWTLDEVDQTYLPLLRERSEIYPIDVPAYIQHEPEHVVWIGARQGVRIGTYGEYEDQRVRRAWQGVREAGSVVVTDA